MVELIFQTKEGRINIQLKKGGIMVDETDLTISQDLDNMLIRTIDKVLSRNKIERLSVKTAEILVSEWFPGGALARQGTLCKIQDEAISSMILKTVRTAVEI